MTDFESETDKILKDKKLMASIRKVRKKGSRSSPYQPLAMTTFETVLKNAKTYFYPDLLKAELHDEVLKILLKDTKDKSAFIKLIEKGEVEKLKTTLQEFLFEWKNNIEASIRAHKKGMYYPNPEWILSQIRELERKLGCVETKK